MALIKLTFFRFVFSYIMIVANWKYALGLDPDYARAFVIHLSSEIAYLFAAAIILKKKQNKEDVI